MVTAFTGAEEPVHVLTAHRAVQARAVGTEHMEGSVRGGLHGICSSIVRKGSGGRRPPRTPDDLASHNCIQYRLGTKGPLAKWHFEWKGKAREIAVAGRLTLNGADLAVRAALDGIGIAYVPEELAAPFLRTGQLTRALESWSAAIEGLFLFYPGRRQVPTALRAFIDMVRAPESITVGRSLKSPF
jgi:DNA-binding transcriptional LysR family regulator